MSLAPGAACSISASLKLSAAAPGAGTLTVYDDAPDSPQAFTVRGIGTYGGDVELVSFSAGMLSRSDQFLIQPFTALVRNEYCE